MFELPVLPADVDHQTVPVKLQSLFFAVLAHLLGILGVLHFDERLKPNREASFVRNLATEADWRICSHVLAFAPPRTSTSSSTSLLIRLVKYLETFPKGSASLRMDSSEKLLEGMFPT